MVVCFLYISLFDFKLRVYLFLFDFILKLKNKKIQTILITKKMKNLLAIVLLVILSNTVIAQEKSIRYGAKAGLNLSSIIVKDSDGLKPRTSFHVGGVVEFPITEKFSIQPEILYSPQGFIDKGKDNSFNFKSVFKLDYLNIPIMAKYYVTKGLSIEGGPQIGFLLSAKADVKQTNLATGKTETKSLNIKKELSTVDLGANIGVGYQLDMGVFLQGRYNIGLLDVDKKDKNEKYNDRSLNSVFQFSVGYKF